MRTTVLIDTGNLYYCIQQSFGECKLDYSYYLDQAVGESDLTAAVAYGTLINDGTQRFADYLKEQGWITEFKEPRTARGKVQRFNWGVGMACMAFRQLPYTEHYVLGVTSGEFVPLVQDLQDMGKKVTILSCGISKALKEASATWIEMGEGFLLCD